MSWSQVVQKEAPLQSERKVERVQPKPRPRVTPTEKKPEPVEDVKKETPESSESPSTEKVVRAKAMTNKKNTHRRKQLEKEKQNFCSFLLHELNESDDVKRIRELANQIYLRIADDYHALEQDIESQIQATFTPVVDNKPQAKSKNKNQKKKEEKNKAKQEKSVQVDDEGFIFKGTASNEKVVEKKVKNEPKKKAKVEPQKNQQNADVLFNNPYAATLLSGSFETPEQELNKRNIKKGAANEKTKKKKKNVVKPQQQTPDMLVKKVGAKKSQVKMDETKKDKQKQQQKQQNAPKTAKASKKSNAKGGKKKKSEKQEQQQQKTTVNVPQTQTTERNVQKKAKKEKNIEKNKSLSKDVKKALAKKRKNDKEWYENEYAPYILVGGAVFVLFFIYSIIFSQ